MERKKEIRCSKQEEETQEDSEGDLEATRRCRGQIQSEGTHRLYVKRPHGHFQTQERHR